MRIITLNLLRDLTRWDERKHLLLDEFEHLQPDVIALQEVALPLNTAEWLAARLRGYSVHLTPKNGRMSTREALATLTRLPVREVHRIDLGAQHRVAQAILLNGPQALTLVNGHFYWSPGDSAQRAQQIRRIHTWIRRMHGHEPERGIVVCGDFNSTPESRSMQLMQEEFVSAHHAHHGAEPAYTVPTPLHISQSPQRKSTPWRGTVDYIFVSHNLRVRDCRIVFDRHAPHDVTLFPSDHLGLVADLETSNFATTQTI
ncbi:MAG: endonuclease/exonuclease/phosphatase family protein [Chloroflexi bacterium]|nr:endonuclease/exonuclease/phosphatase family protein [Chloroflexota bacterium]